MDGILLIDKAEAMTSAQAVSAVKSRLGGPKVGHLGTLDPAATGLLPLCVGAGTKVAQFLSVSRKGYEGILKLGVETDTLDAVGRTVRTAAVPEVADEDLAVLARRFTGRQRQVPPMYSAIKRRGVALYKLARKGLEVEREPRAVEIFSLSLEKRAGDEIAFEVLCSKGTYVRSLAADLGRALGCGAHLLRLRRTLFGPFSVGSAVSVEEVSAPVSPDAPFFVSVRRALVGYREVTVGPDLVAPLRQGRQAVLQRLGLIGGCEGEVVQLVGESGESVALIRKEAACWRLARVL